MKNNIKKVLVKFQEDLLYFYADFCFCSKSVIVTTLMKERYCEKPLEAFYRDGSRDRAQYLLFMPNKENYL